MLDIKDNIYNITEKYPEIIDIFVSNGFENFADENTRKTMGKNISLEMALKSKKINVEQFVQLLEDTIKSNRESQDLSLVDKKEIENPDIKITGVLPCPVKQPLLDGFNKWMEEEGSKLGLKVDYELKAAAGGIDWLKEEIQEAESEETLSDLFISAGFDLFFDRKMMGKFRERGTFEDLMGFDKLNEDFDNGSISLKDPDGEYSIIGIVPAVFLINKEELNGRDIPKSWKDVLKSEFEGRVSLPVSDFDLFNAILLNIYKNYGEEGVRAMRKSLFKGMHPSEMVKSHMKKEKPIVTIMPYFFTKMVKGDGPMVAVWPEDGAVISPIFLLTKKSKKDNLKPFVDFFASKEVGEILAHDGKMPSTNPEVDNQIPEDRKYMWLGWDYIKENDIGSLIEKCESIFNEE